MNRPKRAAIFLALIVLCLSYTAGAQSPLGILPEREYSGFFDSYYYRGPLSFTGGAGISMHMGDLSNGFYSSPGFAFNVGANYKVWPRTMFGVEFQHFSLSGKSNDSIPLTFAGINWGINFYGRLYLVEDIIRKAADRRTNKKVKPYITAGVGFVRYNVTGLVVPASGITPAFPAGLGIECKISPKLQIIPEYTHTFTFNDRLDGVVLGKGKDGYGMLTLKVQYSPFAPKRKKKLKTAPAEPNQNREEHQEWRKKKDPPKPVEEPLPGEGEEEINTGEEENSEEETPAEDE